jgi:hypothetical protein
MNDGEGGEGGGTSGRGVGGINGGDVGDVLCGANSFAWISASAFRTLNNAH